MLLLSLPAPELVSAVIVWMAVGLVIYLLGGPIAGSGNGYRLARNTRVPRQNPIRYPHPRRSLRMSRFAILSFLLPAAVLAAEPPKPATHLIKLDGHTFTLPVGFTVERVAGPPLVDRPIVASFDDRGRLYVADSSGSNEKTADQLKNPTHRIVRLEDTDGDGKFDKSTVFADKMISRKGSWACMSRRAI